jgi:hypothetical protein
MCYKKVLLLACHSFGDVIVCDTFECTNTSIMDHFNEENKQQLKKEDQKNKKSSGKPGVGATFLVVLVLLWYLRQAQFCSLVE